MKTFIKTFVFINFGIIVYYLLIRKLFSFVSDDYLRVTDNNYTPTPPMNTATPDNLPKSPSPNWSRQLLHPLSPKNSTNTPINSTNTPINSTNTPINSTNTLINSTNTPKNSTNTLINSTNTP